MGNIQIVIIAVQLVLLFSVTKANAQLYKAKVVKIKDGDTYEVLINDKKTTIRLAEIDCPELNQEFGKEARNFAKKMILGSTIQIQIIKKEKYQRYLGYLIMPDSSILNEIMVRKGYAWCYSKYSRHFKYKQLEEKSKLDKIGIWQTKNPVAPWIWRKNHKK